MSFTGLDGNQLTVAGFCLFLVICFIKGWLVTKAQHSEVVADRDFWRDQAVEKDRVIATYAETARTSAHVISSIPQAVELSGGSHETS